MLIVLSGSNRYLNVLILLFLTFTLAAVQACNSVVVFVLLLLDGLCVKVAEWQSHKAKVNETNIANEV